VTMDGEELNQDLPVPAMAQLQCCTQHAWD